MQTQQNTVLTHKGKGREKNTQVIATQRPFRWPYTAKSQQQNTYQMTFGDYLKQRHQKGE